MSPEQIYQQLIELAEKLQIRFSEKNLRQAGLRARSGLCRVHGEWIYVMDKKARLSTKIALLAECLGRYPLDEFFLVPAVREVIEKHRTGIKGPPRASIDEADPGDKDGKGDPAPEAPGPGAADPGPS